MFGDGNQTFPLNSGQGSQLPAYQTVVPTRVQLAGFNASQMLTSRVINDTRLSFNRYAQVFSPLDSNFDPASIGLITGAKGGLPTIVVGGFESVGAPTNEPRGRVSQSYQIVDALVWTRDSHTFKAGLDYRRSLVRSYNDQFSRGRLSFNKLADLLAGVAAPSWHQHCSRPDAPGHVHEQLWLVLSRRLETKSAPHSELGFAARVHGAAIGKIQRISNFTPATGLMRVGDGIDMLYERDWNNFAPRIGFAFDPAGNGKTIIRGALRLLL